MKKLSLKINSQKNKRLNKTNQLAKYKEIPHLRGIITPFCPEVGVSVTKLVPALMKVSNSAPVEEVQHSLQKKYHMQKGSNTHTHTHNLLLTGKNSLRRSLDWESSNDDLVVYTRK